MTVVLTPPSGPDTRSAIADWLELETLISSRGRSSRATLLGVLDFTGDAAADPPTTDAETGERLDEAILEGHRDQFVAAAFEELDYRKRCLGPSYPFEVDSMRLVLARGETNPVTHPGQLVYLFCLLASAIRERRLQPANELGGSEAGIAQAFQICACLAAGGYIRGEVSSFGFPRAEGTGFLPALRHAYARFGAGEVRATDDIPDGLSHSLKDGGIDVIAWQGHPDSMPGKIYLLGQCASGRNWRDKSVVEYVDQLHGTWFTQIPARYHLPAMFIPFPFHHDIGERSGPYLAAVRNRFWSEEQRFGIIFDRLRIAYFANSCMSATGGPPSQVDGTGLFHQVREWVHSALALAGQREAPA